MVPALDNNVPPSPAASSIFLPLGRIVRRDSRSSFSNDTDQTAINDALNSIHSAASQSQNLTVFNEYTDPPTATSPTESRTLAGDIQGGLTGLYHKLRASVGVARDDGPQQESHQHARTNSENSSSRVTSGRVSKVQSPRVLAIDSATAHDTPIHPVKVSSKLVSHGKSSLPASPPLKSPNISAQPSSHVVDPALTEVNIHANSKTPVHSRSGSRYDQNDLAIGDVYSLTGQEGPPRLRNVGQNQTDTSDSHRQDHRLKSPSLMPMQAPFTRPQNTHERIQSDHSFNSQSSGLMAAPLTLAASSKSAREDAALSRVASARQDARLSHTHNTKSPERPKDGNTTWHSSQIASKQRTGDFDVRPRQEMGLKSNQGDKMGPKINQSRLPGFNATRTASFDSDLDTVATRYSQVGSDGTSDIFSFEDHNRPIHARHPNKLRSRLLNREFWMRDENARDCFHCGEPFTTFRRKHHCRTCGQIFDNKCTLLINGSHFGSSGDVRVCKPCEMIITSHDDDSSDYSVEDAVNVEAHHRPQTPEPSSLMRSQFRYDDDNVSIISQSFDVAKTPTMSLPVRRALESGSRSQPILEFDTVDRPLTRPSSSRSLRTGHSIGHGHKRHHSRHQHIRNYKAYHDDRAPFQRHSTDDAPRQMATSAFHRDSIIDPELAQYLSDDASSGDEQSIQMVLDQDKSTRTDGDRTAFGGLLAAVRKGRSRIGDRSIASFLNLSRDSDAVSILSNSGVDASRTRHRNHSVSSSTHHRGPPKHGKDRVQIVITNPTDNQSGNASIPSGVGRVSKMIRSASLHGMSAPAMELNRASLIHVHKLLQQLLEDANVSKVSSWQDALVPILLKATDDVDPDVAGGDDMDIRNYVKLKKISGGKPGDTAYISGLVFTKNVALKSMARLIVQPKILIVGFPLEYARHEQHFMSLDPVIRQEREYLDNLVGRIAALKPDLLLAERNISGLALELLDKANIATVFNVKLSVLEAVSRITQTRIVPSIDKLTSGMGQLGTCDSFEVRTFVFDGARKTYVYLSGCSPRLGCTIALRGGTRKTLSKIKKITEFMVYVVYNLKLETCLMRDEWALIPTAVTEKSSADATSKSSGSLMLSIDKTSSALSRQKSTDGDGEHTPNGALLNSGIMSPENEDASTVLSKVNSTEAGDIPDDVPVPTFYEDLVEKHQTKILSASPFVKFMQPYLLMRARELERRVAYLKRLRDQYVSTVDAVDEPCKPQKFTLIQPDMVHASLSGASKRVREIIHAVHDAEYDRSLHYYETQKKQWEAYLSGNRNLFDPSAHQNICVLFSLVSTTTSVPCSGPDLLGFGFYNEHETEAEFEADCTLGQYVEDLCYRGDDTCSSESCGKRMHEHHRQYVHGNAQITVFVQPHPPKMRGLQDIILMWSQCRTCSVETTVTPMSASTWKYSFGKYLELSFWSRDLHARAGICPHDLHRDHLRYFGYKNFALRIHYDPIEILEIIVPRMRITWKVDNDLRYKNDVYTRIEHRITKLMISVKLRLTKSINLDAVPPEKVDECRIEIERLTKRANEQHTMLIKQLQERYTNSKHYETIPMMSAMAAGQDLVAEWDTTFGEFEQKFLPSERDIRRLATLQLKKIFLDRDVSVTSLPSDEGVTGTPADDSPTEKSDDVLDNEGQPRPRRPTLSAEKTQTVLQSVLEEHPVEPREPDNEKVAPSPDPTIDISKMPHVYDGKPDGNDVQHLDLAVPAIQHLADIKFADTPPAFEIPQESNDEYQELDSVELDRKQMGSEHTPRPRSGHAESIPQPIAVPPGGGHQQDVTSNIRRTSDGRSVSPVLLRAQSQPSSSSIRRRDAGAVVNVPLSTASAGNGSNGLVSLNKQITPNTAPVSEVPDHVHEKLSERLGLSHLKNNKFLKGHSFIPRAISKGKESRVSNLAKHFEQLSREFERERIRERKLRASRNRHSRVFPLAASKAIVEVYRDVDEAVDEKSDTTDIFTLGEEADEIQEPGETADTAEGMATTDPAEIHGQTFHSEEPLTEATENETEAEIQASSHAPSETDDKSDTDEPAEVIRLPESPEELLRISQEDLEFKELPKHERTSLMKMLTNFWAERSSSGWTSLEYPLLAGDHIFADCNIIVREDEPSSLIAFALDSVDYKTMLRDIQEHPGACLDEADLSTNIDATEMQADVLHSLLRKTGTHFKYQFQEGPAKMLCKIFFAEQFDAVRRKCGVADRVVESLSRCMKWDSKGGKTKSLFLKTADDRFVLKSLSPVETQSFLKFAPNYFQIMSEAFFHELPSVIAKMLGFYQIILKNPATGVEYNWYLLFMENLFYDRTPTRIFDLKGSMRNRKINATGERNEVLLDENMVEFIYESPLFAREHSKKLLRSSVHNDTLFLARQNVMDYSLMIAIDESRKELVVGIIDCIRTYTWDKKLESWIKDRGFAGGGKNRPTVTSPKEYKRRFREAMGRYVLEAPSCWHQFKPVKVERRFLNIDGEGDKGETEVQIIT